MRIMGYRLMFDVACLLLLLLINKEREKFSNIKSVAVYDKLLL